MKISYIFLLVLLAGLLISCNTSQNNSGINPLPNFDMMWNYRYPDSTEAEFTKILSTLQNNQETSYNAEYHLELLTQIARAQGLQRKFDQADSTLKSAKNLLTENMKTPKIRYLLEKGRLLNSSGKPEDSKPFFLEAYEFGKENELDFYRLDAAHMMGIVADPEEQLNWNYKALAIAENSEDERCKNWLGPLYNNIGWTNHDLGNYDEALNCFEKGLSWRESVNDEKGARIARWTVARTYRSLEKYDQALEMQLNLEKELEEIDEQDGYVLEELGELYLLKKEPAKAKTYFGKAYKILSQNPWLIQNEKERLSRLKKLGS